VLDNFAFAVHGGFRRRLSGCAGRLP